MKANLLKAIACDAWRILFDYFLYMHRYAKHKDKYPIQKKYSRLRKLVTHVSHGFNMDVIVSGKENIPHEVCCFYSNHISTFDPVAIIQEVEPATSFLGKKELEGVPFLTSAIADLEGEYLDRNDLKQSLKVMMRIQKDLEEKHKNWLIFPEGTRNKDDRALLNEFHHGTFRPGVKAGVPLVPIAVFGTQRVMDKARRFKKYPVHLIFGKPIYKEEYQNMTTQEVASLVQSRVQYMLTYEARRADRQYLVKMLGNKFKENL